MNVRLLIIDPQNDFCDIPDAALPVTGADLDMRRLAEFMRKACDRIANITVTLDSHATVGIERTTFWVQANGDAVAPFTEIVENDVRDGRFRPREAAFTAGTLDYLRKLEQGGRYRLMVWPVHCVLGTRGHNIHDAVAGELAHWEHKRQRPAARILKGLNPMTEQYSAIRAEVPIDDDASTQTNRMLIELARPGSELLLVAGEAASHCVAATVQHLLQAFAPAERQRVVLLADCMSAVTGFQRQAELFFEDAAAQGVRVMGSDAALLELARH